MDRASIALSKSVEARDVSSGHPQFQKLEVGQQAIATVASLFLDLNSFTSRSYWEGAAESARVAHAVLSGFTGIVNELGGHVYGLRGDGLYAGFGPGREDRSSVVLAGLAAAAALEAIRSNLNPRLEAIGVKTVVARAGIDFGEVAFMRSGDTSSSEVNVVGFSANFAAKCEKYAKGWEVVVGQGYAEHVPDKSLLSKHEKSPRPFAQQSDTHYYSLYQFKWRELLPDLEGVIAELAGRPLEITNY